VIAVTNSVEVHVVESHHGGVLGSYIRDLSTSLDKFMSEKERDLVCSIEIGWRRIYPPSRAFGDTNWHGSGSK